MNAPERVRMMLDTFDAAERRDRARLNALCHPRIEFHWPPSLLIVRGSSAKMQGSPCP